jgi:hypothetical protein
MYSNEGKAPNVIYKPEFYSMRSSANKIYLDNCYFASELKLYDEDDHTISDSRDLAGN